MGDIFLTVKDRLQPNSEFLSILEKIRNNKLFEGKKIINKMGLYNFIYGPVVEDIKLFLNNQKNELDETTKYMIQTIFNEIYPRKYNLVTKKVEPNLELSFDKEFVVVYLNVLDVMKDILSNKTGGVFEFNEVLDDQDGINEEIQNQYNLFATMIHIIAENAYISIERMKALKQNAVQETGLEAISTQKNLPEDVQKNIFDFARSEIKGGRKSKRLGVNKKRKSTKKYRSK
jgi:hypothetical protein